MVLNIPLVSYKSKQGIQTDLGPALRSFLQVTLNENVEKFATPIAKLNAFRSEALSGLETRATRDALLRYFGQLEMLELRIPDFKTDFTWKDAFNKESVSQSSIAWEKAAVLFNIAALTQQLAIETPRTNIDGFKIAYHLFRIAAGLLEHLSIAYMHAPSFDLSKGSLHTLQLLVTSQAYEVFLENSLADAKTSTNLLARLAFQVQDSYRLLLESITSQEEHMFSASIVDFFKVKHTFYESRAQYFKGMSDDAKDLHGRALCRLKRAAALIKEASKYVGPSESFFQPAETMLTPSMIKTFNNLCQDHMVMTNIKLTALEKDNQLVYHEPIPDLLVLPEIEVLPSLSTVPIKEAFSKPDIQAVIGKELFIDAVPDAVHEAASIYSEEKAQLVRKIQKRVEAVLDRLDMIWIECNVTQLRDVIQAKAQSPIDIPSDLQNLIDQCRRNNSVQALDQTVPKLQQSSDEIISSLKRIKLLLDDEEREYQTMRNQGSVQFVQAPSAPHTKVFREDIEDMENKIQESSRSDRELRAILADARPEIDVILGSAQALEGYLEGDQATAKEPLDLLVDLADSNLSFSESNNRFIEHYNNLLNLKQRILATLQDIKTMVATDEPAQLSLLLNNRTNDARVFDIELAKYLPLQERIEADIDQCHKHSLELARLSKQLGSDITITRQIASFNQSYLTNQRKLARLRAVSSAYIEAHSAAQDGLRFYQEADSTVKELVVEINEYVEARDAERKAYMTYAKLAGHSGKLPQSGIPLTQPRRGTPEASLQEWPAPPRIGPRRE